MNKRAYFLACLNVHLCGHAKKSGGVMLIQSAAWKIPEDAIPSDPARAAFEFFEYFVRNLPIPEWLAAWEESRTV